MRFCPLSRLVLALAVAFAVAWGVAGPAGTQETTTTSSQPSTTIATTTSTEANTTTTGAPVTTTTLAATTTLPAATAPTLAVTTTTAATTTTTTTAEPPTAVPTTTVTTTVAGVTRGATRDAELAQGREIAGKQDTRARRVGGVLEPRDDAADLAPLLEDQTSRSRPGSQERSSSGLFLGGLGASVAAGLSLGLRDRSRPA